MGFFRANKISVLAYRILLFFVIFLLVEGCTPSDENPDAKKSSELSLKQANHSQEKSPLGTPALTLSECNKDDYRGGLARILECGTFAVAENPDDPDGRKILLNIARLPAVSANPSPDPLFIFAGGPGQAATELITAVLQGTRKVNQKRDIVFIDQRGTGKSNPLDCEPEEEPDYTRTFEESKELGIANLKACLAGYDANLAFYTTPYAVDDIDTVRRALGYKKINLWGASYGTRAELVYMRRHPESVRKTILDSVAPIGMNIPSQFLFDADASLKKLFAECESSSACNKGFGDLEKTTRHLIAQLNKTPAAISIRHPVSQKNIQLTINGETLASFLRLALYSREMSSVLPWIITAIQDGDYRAFSVLLFSADNMAGGMSSGLQYTILCSEDVMNIDKEVSNDENSILQLDMIGQMKEICSFWPKAKLPEDYNTPVSSDLPVLLLSGELDPVTPPRWGNKAAETLSNSLHIIVPGTHHGSSFTGCVPDLIAEFLDTASVDSLSYECVKKIKSMAPFVSAAGPYMGSEKMNNETPITSAGKDDNKMENKE